jgi:hypothetical protein
MSRGFPQEVSFPHDAASRADTPMAAPAPHMDLASWYTPGLVDGFGDRLLMFDNTDSEPLEVLRFRPAIAAVPGFEDALRARVGQLAGMTHPSFAAVRAVERLATDGSLALVSTHTTGKRLAAFLGEPWTRNRLSPTFVAAVVTQIIECLSVLQSRGADVAHNALTAERIVLMPGARVCVLEYALDAALRQLRLSPSQLWLEFGLLVPSASPGVAQLDRCVDVFQTAVLGLSLLLSRRLTRQDIQARLPQLVDEWHDDRVPWAGADTLHHWLKRALQLTDDPYRSAAEAYDDLRDLPPEPLQDAYEFLPGWNGQQKVFALTSSTVPLISEDEDMPDAVAHTSPASDVDEMFPIGFGSERGIVAAQEASRFEVSGPGATNAYPAPVPVAAALPPSRFSWRAVPAWVVVALVTAALIEGAVLGVFVWSGRGSAASEVATAPRATPPPGLAAAGQPAVTRAAGVGAPPIDMVSAAATLAPAGAGVNMPPKPDATQLALERAASNQRSGGVRLSAPIDLTVVLGDRVLGSSADGPIVMSPGTYQVELINPALGFRSTQSLTFRAGQISTVAIPVPRGRISLNAQPWAEVWIDDRPAGETPLANLDVAIGEHQVAFRHPQLGERRQRVIVRADSPSRVTATFEP